MMKFLRFAAAPVMALSFLVPVQAPAADFELVGLEMTRLLQNGHYARLPFDERMSERFLTLYLDAIDSERCYFLEAEIADFRRSYNRILHDMISAKEVMPVAVGIFEIYRGRVAERVQFVEEQLAGGEFKFESDRSISRDREKASWPENSGALEQLWRDQLEDLLLTEIVQRERLTARAKELGKPVPFQNDPSPEEKIRLRFERLIKTIEGANDEDVANYFFSSVARAHDPHSEYLSANELEQFKIDVSNELVGIGARLSMNDAGETEIRGIVNGGPADLQGDLELGDRIIAVSPGNDGVWVDIMFKPINRVIEHILGEVGSEVGLRVNRTVEGEMQTLDLTIERGIVTMKDDLTTAQIFEYGEGDASVKLGLIDIPSFYFDFDNTGNRVSVDVLKMLERLKEEEIDGLALDLRNNGGGSLPEVQRLTGFFVGRGPVVQVKSSNGKVEPLNSLNRKPVYGGPMVLLTNKGSASATEILAGALQDYNRAVVVGSASTYGKGTVQKTMDIGDYMPILADRNRAGWLKLTFQKYYRVSGSSVQIKGVMPDLVLPDLSDAYESGEKFQDYALPHDVIRESPGFEPLDRSNLFVSLLQASSEKRVSADQDFSYLLEDIKRAEADLKKNSVSLNLEARVKELQEIEAKRKARLHEREKRFAGMEEQDKKTFKIYKLTLDNVADEVLPLVDSSREEDEYVRSAVDELDDLEETLKWPSGVDSVKREGLQVLHDLVDLTQSRRVALASPASRD
ncbi:carboxy terminal-processing peptidase [Verrucomicrobiaceae bacterium 227]